jgi:tetratricopeptide (TPR) repeat protein
MGLATSISRVKNPALTARPNCRACGQVFEANSWSRVISTGFLVVIFGFYCSWAGTTENSAAAVAKRTFWTARARYQKSPQDSEAAWQFARACFDAADVADSSSERADIAEQGIDACNQLITRDPKSAAAHYYLGMDLGQLARTKGLAALKIVDQMEHEFNVARELDEKFDYAGPDRNLGLLYAEAPSVGSIGSRTKAREHLERAVELVPDYPDNRLNLIESYLKWNQRHGATRELKALEESWAASKAKFSDASWNGSWTGWKQRLATVKKKIEEPSHALVSPRGKE